MAFSIPFARVYGDATHDFYVVTNGDLTDFCADEVPPLETLIGYREDGEFVMRTPPGGADVSTYAYVRPEGNDDIFEWIGQQCEAFFVDGTPLPTPVASGFTSLRVNTNPDIPFWASEVPIAGFYRNGATGSLTDAEGNLWDLSTRAVFP